MAEIAPDPRTIPAPCRRCCIRPRSSSRRPGARSTSASDNWWKFKRDANWRQPYGPGSSIEAWTSILSSMSRTRMSRPTLPGLARRCRPRRNGNSRRAAGSMRPSTPGAQSSRRATGHGEHLAGRIPEREPEDGRLSSALRPVEAFPAERLRDLRHDRQRLGMDAGLVLEHEGAGARSRAVRRRTRGAAARGELRPAATGNQDSAQGAEGRVSPVRAELLPPLPAGGAPRATRRHVHQPRRLSPGEPRPGHDARAVRASACNLSMALMVFGVALTAEAREDKACDCRDPACSRARSSRCTSSCPWSRSRSPSVRPEPRARGRADPAARFRRYRRSCPAKQIRPADRRASSSACSWSPRSRPSSSCRRESR